MPTSVESFLCDQLAISATNRFMFYMIEDIYMFNLCYTVLHVTKVIDHGPGRTVIKVLPVALNSTGYYQNRFPT